MSLYSSSVKRPVTTILVFVALIVLGLFSLRSLPIDLFPDVETNTIMVMTSYAGTSASDIEQNVTRPLENALNSVEHLKHITSNSRENISIVTLEFEYGYNIETLTNDVCCCRYRLARVCLACIRFLMKTLLTRWLASMAWVQCPSPVLPSVRSTSIWTPCAWRHIT